MTNKKAKHRITFFVKRIGDAEEAIDAVSRTFPSKDIEVKIGFKFFSFETGSVHDDEHLINLEFLIEDNNFDIENNDFSQKVRLMVASLHKQNSNISFKSTNTKHIDDESVIGNTYAKRWVPI